MQESLGNDNSDVQKVLKERVLPMPHKDLIGNTKLEDVAVRKQLYEGGQAAIDASTDPLILSMRAIDADARDARREYEDKIDSVVRRDGATIAKARFAQSGFSQPPDATFTLRLSYGLCRVIRKWQAIPFDTNLGGAYEHAAATQQPAALQPARELDEVEVKGRPEDTSELRFHRRHHRRQFRLAHHQ